MPMSRARDASRDVVRVHDPERPFCGYPSRRHAVRVPHVWAVVIVVIVVAVTSVAIAEAAAPSVSPSFAYGVVPHAEDGNIERKIRLPHCRRVHAEVEALELCRISTVVLGAVNL